jgi:cytoskeleton protein RodZ
MTEDSEQITEQNPVPAVPEPELTAGALIHRAREAAGLHIAALAVSLKVPVKRLEALEADRYDLLPDAVFVRALAGSVCRTLKVDSTEILRLLPSQSAPRLGHWTEGRRKLEGATIPTRRPTLSETTSRPAIVGGLVLILGALALVFLPPLDFLFHKTDVTESDMVITTPMPVMAVEPSNPDQVSASPAAAAGSVLTAAEGVQTGTPPTTGIVVFRPTAESWVEVTDTKGTVLLRRKLTSGEVAGATGALPLSVVVGRADVTKVQIRGQAFDLTPVSRDNVARFEVK